MRTDSTKKKTRTGTLEAHGANRRARLRLGDCTKSHRFDLPEGLTAAQARAAPATLQAQGDATGQVLAAKRDQAREDAARSNAPNAAETCATWHARFLLSAARADYEDANKMAAGRWSKWISPHIGSRPMAAVSSDDIELVRDGLDTAIRAKAHAPRTAQNVWSVLTTAFTAARNAKQRDLRVHRQPRVPTCFRPRIGRPSASIWCGRTKAPRSSRAPPCP
ncbi:MAG: hypothetical protein HOO96_38635 [Polyangiaceae bacterium]|nr:hypothetical protein [Polyangiaceae bacterium]